MKKIVLLTAAILTVFMMSSCKDSANEYAGTYKGTFSIVASNKTVNGTLVFTSGISDEENLYLYGAKLTKVSDNQYTSDSKLLRTIIALFSTESADQIENINATFNFSGSQVTMELKYKVLNLADITVITFTGTKQ